VQTSWQLNTCPDSASWEHWCLAWHQKSLYLLACVLRLVWAAASLTNFLNPSFSAVYHVILPDAVTVDGHLLKAKLLRQPKLCKICLSTLQMEIPSDLPSSAFHMWLEGHTWQVLHKNCHHSWQQAKLVGVLAWHFYLAQGSTYYSELCFQKLSITCFPYMNSCVIHVPVHMKFTWLRSSNMHVIHLVCVRQEYGQWVSFRCRPAQLRVSLEHPVRKSRLERFATQVWALNFCWSHKMCMPDGCHFCCRYAWNKLLNRSLPKSLALCINALPIKAFSDQSVDICVLKEVKYAELQERIHMVTLTCSTPTILSGRNCAITSTLPCSGKMAKFACQ